MGLDGLREFDRWNRQTILGTVATIGVPSSYLDVGCGTGAMVRAMRGLAGICQVADGVDLDPGEGMMQHDLRLPLNLGKVYDLVSSIEVAEHVDPAYEDVLVDSIARHVAHEGYLVFTAAMPGQQGDGHVNCQTGFYWRGKFSDRGLIYDIPTTCKIVAVWNYCTGPNMHLPGNVQVFRRPPRIDA